MRKINWRCSTPFVGAVLTGEIEVEDHAEEEDVNELVLDDLWNHLNLDWSEHDIGG